MAGYAPINDVGQAAVHVALLDGRAGLFVTNVPEPSPELLALGALLALAALRRRSAQPTLST